MQTTDKLTRKNWERIAFLIVIGILIFALARMCQAQRTAVASLETKEKLKDNKDQQQTVNKDRTAANESATTQSTSEVEKVSQRNKKARLVKKLT